MNRLLKEMDRLVETGIITERVFAQVGKSDYIPRYYEYKAFISPQEYQNCVDNADLIITHGGTGAIIKGLKAQKQVIAIPRLYKYHEHENDHQLQIVDFFAENGFIQKVMEVSELEEAIQSIKANPIQKKFQGNGRVGLIIDDFIAENEKQRKHLM